MSTESPDLPPPIPAKRRHRWQRWLLGLTLALVLAVVAAFALVAHWIARPPETPGCALRGETPVTVGNVTTLGPNRFVQGEGLNLLYLEGSPYCIGYANGVLTAPLMHAQEDAVMDLFHTHVKSRAARFLLRLFVIYANRDLPDYVLPRYQMEIAGLADGCPDVRPEEGPYFHRLLNYHGAQDISYLVMNNPLLSGGCTAFGAWGDTTGDGHLLMGRNFDWEAAEVFDRDRVLVFCRPDDGYAFASLSWGGMAGVVTGMNEAGLAIEVNGAPSDLPEGARTPTCFIVREVLEKASTIDEAVAIIRQRPSFVSAIFLVGSRADERFVTVEKTARRTQVREAGDADFIVAANHFHTPGLEDSDLNQLFIINADSVPREDRMTELLRTETPVDAPRAVALLRDRKLPRGRETELGDRRTLNALIATHAAVFDLTTGTVWAANAPHQLGRFEAFTVTGEPRPGLDIDADPLLTSGQYDAWRNERP